MEKEYKEELQRLKPYDEVQFVEDDTRTGYRFISTAGHGYLAVPHSGTHGVIARKICKYGFIGKLASYLEEDCEYGEFCKAIKV